MPIAWNIQNQIKHLNLQKKWALIYMNTDCMESLKKIEQVNSIRWLLENM